MKAEEHNLDTNTLHLLRQTIQHFREHNQRAYLTGGSLRNLLLGEPCGDWDIVTDGDVPLLARSLADKLAGYYVHLHNKASRVVVKHEGQETIIDIAPIKGNSIEEDLGQRDFTINAIAAPLAEIVQLLETGNVVVALAGTRGGVGTRDILIDPLNGFADIQARQLKAVDDNVFKHDPLRMLRAVRLKTRYRLTIEPETENLIKRDARLLPLAAPERIHDELYAILESDGATVQLRYLDALGLFTVLIPEFIPARGMRQPSPHYWDVLEHSLESVGALERLAAAIRQGYAGIPVPQTGFHKGPYPTLPHPRPYGGEGRPEVGVDAGKGRSDKGDNRPDAGEGRSDKGDGRPDKGDNRLDVEEGRPDKGDGRPDKGDNRPDAGEGRSDKGDNRPDVGEGRSDKGEGGTDEVDAGLDTLAEIRTLLREAEQQGIFQFDSLTAPRMKLAALLHDVGKPITYFTGADGNIHFYDHPQAGIPLAQQIMTRLSAGTQDRRLVQLVVAHHMRPGQLAHLDTVTPRAIRRYFVDLGPVGIHVALFSLADHIATLGPVWDEYTKRPDNSWERHLALVRLLLTRYVRERESILPARLVGPEELMRRLKLEPGPLIGQLLEYIGEAQAEGQIHSKEEALWLAEEKLHGRK